MGVRHLLLSSIPRRPEEFQTSSSPPTERLTPKGAGVHWSSGILSPDIVFASIANTPPFLTPRHTRIRTGIYWYPSYSYLHFDRPPLYRIRCLSIDRVGAWQPGIAASTSPDSGSQRAGNLVNTSAPQPVGPPQLCSWWRCTLGFHE